MKSTTINKSSKSTERVKTYHSTGSPPSTSSLVVDIMQGIIYDAVVVMRRITDDGKVRGEKN